ncbi:Thoeris anti-defense Tad2 family protein [Microvirga ossetica]|uniref:Thoeris anti-defense Tad2 family protein n=1 Tax=Microvirga ossetica TaxID=1882682 RepID=UPI003AAB92CA
MIARAPDANSPKPSDPSHQETFNNPPRAPRLPPSTWPTRPWRASASGDCWEGDRISQTGQVAEVLPYIIMKTADDKILMGWLASQTDTLAEDWIEIEAPEHRRSYWDICAIIKAQKPRPPMRPIHLNRRSVDLSGRRTFGPTTWS